MGIKGHRLAPNTAQDVPLWGRVNAWITTHVLILSCRYSEADYINPYLFIHHLFNTPSLSIYYVIGIMLRKMVSKINWVSVPV